MEPFLGQIIMFGGNFAPRGWALCQGQLLPISSNQALFSILGTIYGGDGRTTFALPDLRGRAPIQQGSGPGLSSINLGEKAGSESHTLLVNNLPAHNHGFALPMKAEGDTDNPAGGFVAGDGTNSFGTVSDSTGGAGTTSNTGGNTAVNHRDPFLGVNFIIALQGTFPSRS
ncbi:MAG: phage tail protein [Allomuricauda sp.]|nr:MAG: phage tail protein [Allomuricauda sp.]